MSGELYIMLIYFYIVWINGQFKQRLTRHLDGLKGLVYSC